jgi:hypothetical protein
MWDQAPNSAALSKSSIPAEQPAATWRRIEAALQDYFRGANDGDVFAEIEADADYDDCDECPPHFAELNLTSLARHIADWLGGGA